MSHDLHEYGTAKPIIFKITLNGVGVNASLAAGDVKISKDGGASANVSNLPTAVDSSGMPGVFSWTPTIAETQAETVTVNIKDASDGAFDENMITLQTGGNASARFAG